MNRLRASLAFVFTGGLLIFLSPYFIYQAVVKRLPWTVPIIVIPIYVVLSYGAFKTFWPHIIVKPGTPTLEKDDPNRLS
jgi:hypothetical protein